MENQLQYAAKLKTEKKEDDMNKLNELAKPVRIGNITAKNRLWMSPLWTRTASAEGEVTDRTIAHYAARARGGAGLIGTEGVAVDPAHTWVEPQMRIDHNRFAPGHRRLVEEVHMYNTPIICQLHHAGMFGNDPVSPSGVPAAHLGRPGHYLQPKALSLGEVEGIRDMFIDAAVRAKEVGYDGVELHGATGYLLEQFYSPHNNKRIDKYGGSLEGRTLLALEILRGIRAILGPDYVIGYTVVDNDMIPGCVDREQTSAFARMLEESGLTYLDLQTDGTYETFHLTSCSGGYKRQPQGQFDKTEYYKSIVNIPVTTRSTAQYDPVVWNDAFEKGMADAVRLGKPMLADADLARKAIKGDIEDIRECIHCGNCYMTGAITNWELSCTVNPGLGRMELPVDRAPVSKTVLVIGGGPGGLEAARVAALRGHSVTLVEKDSKLGGLLNIATLPIAKNKLIKFAEWGERQCRKLGVTVRLNTEATVALVDEMKPDVVIVATGSDPLVPPIAGVDKPHVVTAADVLLGNATIGKKVVVAGAGEVGLETADLLMDKGEVQDLTIVEMLPQVGMDMNPVDMAQLFGSPDIFPTYFQQGLKILTETRVEEITEKGVIVSDRNWNRHEIEADTVILALGYVSNNKLYEELEGKSPELYALGDAVRPAKIWDAIHQADCFVRQI